MIRARVTGPRALFISLLLAILTAAPSHAILRTCPYATVLCVEPLSYNFQTCGEITGQAKQVQEFPTCYDLDAGECAPCWFDGVSDTVTQCQARFGNGCTVFYLQNQRWPHDWRNLDKPDFKLEWYRIKREFGFED